MHHAVTPVPFVDGSSVLTQAVAEAISFTLRTPLSFVLVSILNFAQWLELSLSELGELDWRIVELGKLFVKRLKVLRTPHAFVI